MYVIVSTSQEAKCTAARSYKADQTRFNTEEISVKSRLLLSNQTLGIWCMLLIKIRPGNEDKSGKIQL